MEPEQIIAHHAVARASWVRAAALRMIYGVVSVGALLVGVAAAAHGEGQVLLAGLAGVWAGAIALAMAEYMSTCAQDEGHGPAVARATAVAQDDPVAYHRTGGAHDLAGSAAPGRAQGASGAALADYRQATPLQVAVTSAGIYVVGGAVPLAAASAFALDALPLGIGLVGLGTVAVLAALRAGTGRAAAHGALRAATWAAVAMTVTFAVGRMFGAALI